MIILCEIFVIGCSEPTLNGSAGSVTSNCTRSFLPSISTRAVSNNLVKLFLRILSSFAAITFSSDLRSLSLENEEATKDFLPRNLALS